MPIFLTREERRKLRRQNRLAIQKELQEKQALGMIPPPPPKVKLANLMRVLGNEAIQDPTKMEQFVRAQVADRKRKHEATNEARKLTPEERRLKRLRKLCDAAGPGAIAVTSSIGVAPAAKNVYAAVYRVRDLNHPALKYKVETNARQLLMTGVIVIHKDCNVVVVEGGTNIRTKIFK